MASSDNDSSDDELFAALTNAADAGGDYGGGAARSLFSVGSSAVLTTTGAAAPTALWSSSDEEVESASVTGNDSSTRHVGEPRPSTPKPKTVGSYIVGAKIGEGAYATVREGLNTDTLRIVAVKIVDMRRLRKVKGGVESIKREIKVQKALKRHPRLIELLHVHEDIAHARMYLFMEMATGCTLQELLDSAPEGKLPPSQVAFFLHQTLSGLLCMHGRGVVHRDIKPSNLMLNANSALKIADFGVAEFLDQYTTDDNVTRTSGSPAFQAPEIANGEVGYSGMKVDVWAVGVSAYFLLVGRIPFHADTLVGLFSNIATGDYAEPTELGTNVCDAIRQMLEVDWHKRASVECMLKHPWIARSERMPPCETQEREGWLRVAKKEFSILGLAQRLVEDEGTKAHTSAVDTPSASLTSSIRSSLPRSRLSKSMFALGPDSGDSSEGAPCEAHDTDSSNASQLQSVVRPRIDPSTTATANRPAGSAILPALGAVEGSLIETYGKDTAPQGRLLFADNSEFDAEKVATSRDNDQPIQPAFEDASLEDIGPAAESCNLI
jgi:serine/threonine protein kinase